MRKRTLHLLAIASLLLIFLWVYGRFAGRLFFVLDDYIETEAALARTLPQALRDSLDGTINWSGYRPLAYAVRAALAHAFGLERMPGYYVASLLLHLTSILLTYHIVWRMTRQVAWSMLAATWLLLLPAHNEAVLYMSANASLLALVFALAALELSITALRQRPPRWLTVSLAGLAYALALLSYEVVIALPLLVLLADWAIERGAPRRNLRLYGAFLVALLVVVAMRLAAGPAAAGRADYALDLNPIHVARGYTILLGQMVFLHSSPWLHLPIFSYFREWMSPANPRAIASMLLVAGLTATTLVLALRSQRVQREERRPGAPFWLVWGLLWVAAISLPFAALSGRNPENRYTTIPAFGMAIAATALVAWLWRRLHRFPVLRWASVGLAIGLFTFYAYVDTSDVSEWERASEHTRAFYSGVLAALPILPEGTVVGQVGVPGSVGAAYVFTTSEAFDAAMRLRYGAEEGRFASADLEVRTALLADQPPVLLAYDRVSRQTQVVDAALLCSDISHCRVAPVAAAPLAEGAGEWTYAQIYEPALPEQGGLALLVERRAQPSLLSCWAFHDLERTAVDPSTFDNAALESLCRAAFQTLSSTGHFPEAIP